MEFDEFRYRKQTITLFAESGKFLFQDLQGFWIGVAYGKCQAIVFGCVKQVIELLSYVPRITLIIKKYIPAHIENPILIGDLLYDTGFSGEAIDKE